jgi:hypothetical protein
MALGPTWKVKATPSISVRAVKRHVLRSSNAVVVVKVRAGHGVTPEGKIKVSWGKAKGAAKTVGLVDADDGVARIVLPKLPKGRHILRAEFTDTTGKLTDATAKRHAIRVTG